MAEAFTIDTTSWRSPNYDKTASGAPITHTPEGMTLHSDEGTRASSLPWLCNPASKVSAQYYVCRPDASGRVDIYQLVPDTYRAWHAGASSYDGLTDWNKTIGVEAEHKAGQDWPKAQIDALTWLFQTKITAYKLPRSRIAMHRTVATPPGRKIDPTNWSDADFARWADALYALKARTIPGPPGTPAKYCSVEALDFYTMRGGFAWLGYALRDEFTDGEDSILVCERTVNKRSVKYGSEFALIGEAIARGWIG